MKNRLSYRLVLMGLGSLVLSYPAAAVVVAGANGGAGTTHNTTVGQLNTALGTTFSNFNNVIKYSDSSGVYLGYNPGTKDVWVMSARHVSATGNGSTLTIDGNLYTQQGSQVIIANSDIVLIKYKNALNLVPSMPSVSLASVAPAINKQIIMLGWGVDRVQGPSTDANTSDAVAVTGGNGSGYVWRSYPPASNQFLRWGTNNVDTPVQTYNMGGIYTTSAWSADFDQPTAGQWLTSNEASAALLDSGSGAFAFIDGTWQLVGTASGTFASSFVSPFTSGSNYQGTIYTNVSSYHSAITSAIGITLVPEPSTPGLLLLGCLGLLMNRRR